MAIVTGAGQGIGHAIACRLGDEGATVVAAHRSEDTGKAVTNEVRARGGEAIFIKTDVTNATDVQRLVDETGARFGRIDSVCNNAGIDLARSIEETTDDEFSNVIDVNIRGVFLVCRSVIPVMRAGGGGSIINVASVAALIGLPQTAAYAASKGAVLSLTRQLARDYAQDGIRANSVCPGSSDTPQLRQYLSLQPDRETARARVENLNPMRRIGQASEIAAAVVFLASAESSFITGIDLVVDGGLVIQ